MNRESLSRSAQTGARLSEAPGAPATPGAPGADDEREAARQVREMFSRIAPRYDFLNHLLSFEMDRVWRRRVAERFRHILSRADARALDLCCGTGDLAFALRAIGPARIYGCDFARPMLVRAREKAGGASAAAATAFAEADALLLPFPDGSFDLAASAFGFRNLANYERGLAELHRVLRPGGEVGIVEFTAPQGTLLGALYRFYFTRVLPRIGGAISDPAAYSYLPASVEKFPSPEALAALMSRSGFREVRFERWTFGAVALHTARRA